MEWRVVNAAQYGAAQRRRRTFIYAYKDNTVYGQKMSKVPAESVIKAKGLMAKTFPIQNMGQLTEAVISKDIVDVSDNFAFMFENAGYMHAGKIYTSRIAETEERAILLGEILQKNVDEKYYIPSDKKAKWVYLTPAVRENPQAASF